MLKFFRVYLDGQKKELSKEEAYTWAYEYLGESDRTNDMMSIVNCIPDCHGWVNVIDIDKDGREWCLMAGLVLQTPDGYQYDDDGNRYDMNGNPVIRLDI